MVGRREMLLLVLLTGCVSPESTHAPIGWQSLKVDSDPGPDRVLLDVALIQRPIDDEFLSSELWANADEMVVPADRRELLELNGFRVGVLVGSPPEQLTHLLQSERSCLERKGRSAPSGHSLTQKLRECPEQVDGFVQLGRTKEILSLDRPHFGLDLLPTLRRDHTMRLRVTPRYEAGDKAVNYKPLPEESKWSLEVARPSRSLVDLSFEIDLSPNQILIIGPRVGCDGSLGTHGLTADREGEAFQRLLILRHLRPRAGSPSIELIEVEHPDNPPLAIQASTSRR